MSDKEQCSTDTKWVQNFPHLALAFLSRKEDQRLAWQKDYLSRLREADYRFKKTYELIQVFTTMLRERKGEQFDSWLERVEKQGVVELQSYAQNSPT